MAGASPSPSVSSTVSLVDPRVQYTFDIVDWDALSSLACKLHNADSAQWGDQLSGGYNLVRFLHLHDARKTVLFFFFFFFFFLILCIQKRTL
jgi:hypothetical protein